MCPGMGRLWSRDGRDALRRFAQLGGYGHGDVASVKLHQRIASDPPETMLELADLADRTLHEAGVHPRLWSTGTSYTLPLERPLDALTARAYAARYFLVGLYARGLNVERMYFYNWGGTKIPIVLQAEGGVPTSAALAVEQLQRWLAHASSRSCGHGDAIGLPANVWRCEVTVTGDGGTHGAAVMWTVAGTAEIPASRDTTTLRRLDGTSHAVRPGDTITVGQEPIFVEGQNLRPSVCWVRYVCDEIGDLSMRSTARRKVLRSSGLVHAGEPLIDGGSQPLLDVRPRHVLGQGFRSPHRRGGAEDQHHVHILRGFASRPAGKGTRFPASSHLYGNHVASPEIVVAAQKLVHALV